MPVYASNAVVITGNYNFDCELLESIKYINLLLFYKIASAIVYHMLSI